MSFPLVILTVLAALASGRILETGRPAAEPAEVAPGVFVFSPGNTTDDFVDGNTTVVIGTHAVLVVDAPSVRLARDYVRWIRGRTKLPIRYLVNTHWHYDHIGGNQVYADEFPGVEIVATSYTKQVSDDRNPAVFLGLRGPRADSLLQMYRKTISAGPTTKGDTVTAYDVQRARESLAYIEREAPFWRQLRYTGPSLTFERELRLDLGDREVVLREYQGHTQGDAVVLLPKEGVLVTGDLVIAPVPYGIHSHFRAWSETLGQLEAITGVKTIVPGHGPVLKSWDYVRAERELIDTLLTQVAAGVRVRLTLEQVRARVDLSRFERQLAGSDPARRWGFRNYFLEPGVERAYEEIRGDW